MMNRFCFVHAADLHLDTPFEDIGCVPPLIADALRDASLNAWETLVQLALAREAEFVLLAGDIYDGPVRGVRAQVRFRAGLERLAERSIQVFIVLGNHDPLDGWSAVPEWPSGVTVFGSNEVESVPVVRGTTQLATIHGMSYPRRDCMENLAVGFQRSNGAGLQIGVLHCNVGGITDHAAYSPCTVEDLRRAGLDYWALGHVHQRTYLGTRDPWIVYPGDLQGRGTATREQGPKGAVIVEVEDDVIRHAAFEALDDVRIIDLDCDTSALPDAYAVRRLLLRNAEELRDSFKGKGILVQVILGGGGAVSREMQQAGGVASLLHDLRQQSEGWSPFVWWAAITHRAQGGEERDALRGRNDLLAELLRKSETLSGDHEQRTRFLDQRFEPLLRKWVAEIEPGEADDLLREATELAIELLSGEETS